MSVSGASGPATAALPPLSDQLKALFHPGASQDLTLNELLARTADRGPFGLIILLCLPFMAPFAIPGLSNVFGVVIVLLSWRILRGEPARLPKRIGNRSVQGRIMVRVITASIRVLGWVERLTRPRGPEWLQGDGARRFNALVLAFGGLLLAAPIPPIIPISNLVPAVGILLVAASMMDRDGVMIWMGYAATVGGAVYIAAMAVFQYHVFLALWRRFADPVSHFLRSVFP